MSDFLLDTRDLQIRVDNPQKHLSTLETYITFRITTRVRMRETLFCFNSCGIIAEIIYFILQTSRAEFDDTEYVIRRRYNDFIWLREKLVLAYPNNLIPVSIDFKINKLIFNRFE
jgi:sorting nexin-7/30